MVVIMHLLVFYLVRCRDSKDICLCKNSIMHPVMASFVHLFIYLFIHLYICMVTSWGCVCVDLGDKGWSWVSFCPSSASIYLGFFGWFCFVCFATGGLGFCWFLRQYWPRAHRLWLIQPWELRGSTRLCLPSTETQSTSHGSSLLTGPMLICSCLYSKQVLYWLLSLHPDCQRLISRYLFTNGNSQCDLCIDSYYKVCATAWHGKRHPNPLYTKEGTKTLWWETDQRSQSQPESHRVEFKPRQANRKV